MPRGKNYVNQNKGMTLQASSASDIKEQCYYGAQCQRKDCIYKHDGIAMTIKRSNDPCMAFLAGFCSFTDKTCRKRHSTEDEANALRAKYGAIKCRFQGQCKTKGCLYIHVQATDDDTGSASANGAFCRTSTPGSAANSIKTNGKSTAHAAAQKIKKKSKPHQPTGMLSPLEEPNAFPPLPTALGRNGANEDKMAEPSHENQTPAPPDNQNHSQTTTPPAYVAKAWGPATATAANVPALTSTEATAKSPSISHEIPMVAVAAVVPMAWSDVTKRPLHAPMTTAVSSPLPLAAQVPDAPIQIESTNTPSPQHLMYDSYPPPPSQADYSHHMMMMYHHPPPPLPPSAYPMSMVPPQMMDPYINPALYHAPPELHPMAPHHGHFWAPPSAAMMNMNHSTGTSGSNSGAINQESLSIHAKEFVPGGATNS